MDDDPLSGLGLHPVTLADQARFDPFFKSLADPLSDYTFSQVFTWSNSLRIFWKEIRGHLCIFANGTGDLTMLMPPIGEGASDRALSEAFDVMDAYNVLHNAVGRSRLEYVSEELLCRFNRSGLAVTPMGTDYLYDVQRMIDLAGGDLASKRQLKNRFLRNYECRVEIYDGQRHQDPCRQLLHLWKQHQDEHCTEQDTTNTIKRHKEVLACELALEHAHTLGLKGMVVYVRPNPAAHPGMLVKEDWSLRGFTFGEALGTNQSSIVIEKTDLEIKGLAQFIFSEFCARCWSHRPLVNAGDDWGLENLAWTKMSYRPTKLLQKYDVRLAQRVAVAMPVGGRTLQAVAPAQCDTVPVVCSRREERGMPDVPVVGSIPAVVAGGGNPPAAVPVVRAARKEDLTAAVQLEQTCFSAHCLSKRRLQYLQSRPSAVFLVADDGGAIVGDCISLVRKHRRGRSGRIYSLAVRVDHRGRKIGQRLLQTMIADLASRGVKRIYLEVEQSNVNAVRLYERYGFRRIGELPDYYGEGKPGWHMVYEVETSASPTPQPVGV